MDSILRVKDFLDDSWRISLQLRLVAGEEALGKEIRVGDINRPGLTLAGFYDFFAFDRIQIFGLGETAYMRQLSDEQRRRTYDRFFSYEIKCCIFTHNEEPDELFIEYANNNKVPVFVTRKDTTRFSSQITLLLDQIFSPSVTVHGTLIDVYGVGVLILGKSGVGKSECALELVERGHLLVADDMVIVKKIDESLLIGTGSPVLTHHMEIRGIGIINVQEIFGIRSVRNRKRVELVVMLEEWDNSKEYDRLGLEETSYPILDIDVPLVTVPVRPGRNIPIIVETASLNQRLKRVDIHSARELDENIQDMLKSGQRKE
ncbi:MAG: HPr kinase/phosphorylase [Spirochaetes bacterium]|nr:HPr kinase/phosphorylase [Spirochaetota bacterium]